MSGVKRILEGYYKSRLAVQLFYNIVLTAGFAGATVLVLLMNPVGLLAEIGFFLAWQVAVLFGLALGFGITATASEWLSLYRKIKV